MALVNEGARILMDGTARSCDDIDTVWRYGYGFPAARSGPMAYAASLDRTALLARLRELQHEDPAFWNAAVVEKALALQTVTSPKLAGASATERR